MEKLRTLIIHPIDASTQFLKSLYIDDATILTSPTVGNGVLKQAIKEHDRIVMMGHRCSAGLYCPTNYNRLLISSKHVQMLREKLCIGIWCFASDFFEKYKLHGAATGMFISETDESWYFPTMNSVEAQPMIDESHKLLTNSFKNGEYQNMLSAYKQENLNEIQKYNADRIRFFD